MPVPCWIADVATTVSNTTLIQTPIRISAPALAPAWSTPSRSGTASIRRLTRSRSNTPHVDDLPPPPQQQPADSVAEEVSAAGREPAAEADEEAQRTAFLAATEGFAFEGPVVVRP